MGRGVEKDNRYCVGRGRAGFSAERPVLLLYVIAWQEGTGPSLLHLPLGFGEVTLPVFSSWAAAQSFVPSSVSEGKCYVKECTAGELVSLLLGPYVGIEWVLLDPVSRRFSVENTSASLISRERFIDYLLGNRYRCPDDAETFSS